MILSPTGSGDAWVCLRGALSVRIRASRVAQYDSYKLCTAVDKSYQQGSYLSDDMYLVRPVIWSSA